MKKLFVFGFIISGLLNLNAHAARDIRSYAMQRVDQKPVSQPQKLDHNFNGKWHVLSDGRYMIHCSGGGKNWAASSGMALPNKAHGDQICGGAF